MMSGFDPSVSARSGARVYSRLCQILVLLILSIGSLSALTLNVWAADDPTSDTDQTPTAAGGTKPNADQTQTAAATTANAAQTQTLAATSANPAASPPDSVADTSTGGLQEVTVKAVKLSPIAAPLVVLKDVPQSISVVSGQELQSLNALDVTEVLDRVGNAQWNYGNPMTGSLSIRGVSSSGGGTIDPSLGTTVDGVPLASTEIASELDYVDVSTISVTRGPQGSTGGLNDTMGTIAIVDNAPTFTTQAYGSLTLGIRSAVVAQGVFGGPVIDDLLAWRATFYRDEENGPYNNAYPGNEGRYSWDNVDRTLGRLQFLLTPTDDLHMLLSVTSKPNGIEFVNGLTQAVQEPATYANGAPTYIPNGLPGATNTVENKYTRSYFTDQDPNAYQNYLGAPVFDNEEKGVLNATYGGVFHVTWDLPWATLQSISGFDFQHFQASNGTGEWDVSYDGGADMKYRQESEELDITSKPGGFLDYTTGLFYLQSSDWNNGYPGRAIYGYDAGAYDANAAQYATLDSTAAGILLMQNSLNGVDSYNVTWNLNKTEAAFGQLDWHLASPLTLTTGIRESGEDRHTEQDKGVSDPGSGAALNPAIYGGFNTNAAGALTTNTPEQLALANSVAQQYFDAASYSALTPAEQAQVAAARAIRASNVYTGLFSTEAARPYKGWLPSGDVSLTYKLTPEVSSYLTWDRGVKAGISQLASVGGVLSSYPVKPETSNDYEFGVKGSYFDTLTVNLDYYLDYINNYQQTVYVYDSVLSAENGVNTYDSLTGNAAGIETNGAELDAAFVGIKNLALRFAGDYNHAFYNKDVLLSNAVEDGNISPAYHDAKGEWLANAPRFTGNLSGEYVIPVLSNKIAHLNFNYHYTSRFNSDTTGGFSEYAWVNGYGLFDFGVGFGRQDRKFDVTFLVKNAFDTAYRVSQTWTSYIPGLPRWYGINFSGTL